MGINLQWLDPEIQMLLQLHKMPEGNACAVIKTLVALECLKNDNAAEGYKENSQ